MDPVDPQPPKLAMCCERGLCKGGAYPRTPKKVVQKRRQKREESSHLQKLEYNNKVESKNSTEKQSRKHTRSSSSSSKESTPPEDRSNPRKHATDWDEHDIEATTELDTDQESMPEDTMKMQYLFYEINRLKQNLPKKKSGFKRPLTKKTQN